jgi:hypothetical protein
LHKNNVTHSGSIFTMELYCTPKVNTLQLNRVRNSSNTRTRPTRTVSEHSLLKNSSNTTSCGSLPTLTPILAVRKLSNTRRDNVSSGYRSLAHHNSTLAYIPSLTCHLPAPTIGCLHSNDSQTTLFYVTMSVEVRRLLIPYLWRCLSIVASVTLLLV